VLGAYVYYGLWRQEAGLCRRVGRAGPVLVLVLVLSAGWAAVGALAAFGLYCVLSCAYAYNARMHSAFVCMGDISDIEV
jgi:hypothetical protein